MDKLANNIPIGGFTLPGSLGAGASNGPGALERVISTAIGVMTIIAFIWFVFQFFLAAISIIGSGGDKNALAQARGKLSTSVIGLVVVIAAIFLIEIIGTILGIQILGIAGMISQL